jgi:DNA polymerase III delta prime subunit
MREDFLWTEAYRPKKVSETILPTDLKTTFQKFVDNGQVPNLLLCGGPGVGKTTIAKAMLEELDSDYIVVNGSLNGNIDTLRNDIQNFASSVSLMGGRKYVILDEADGLNSNSTQPALRAFMEEFSRNCGFILTCNFKNRIIKPISDSRVSVIDFKIKKSDMPKLAAQFFDRVKMILEKENIQYDPKVVAEVITKYFPDWRRVLNELQRYSATGSIDSGILSNLQDVSIKELIGFMKEKDFTNVRKWIAQNSEADQSTLFRNFYDTAVTYFKPVSIPQLVLALGKYQYQAAFAADPEINLAACMVEIMVECEFI